ncbi:MAG: hypothetical protein HY741_30020 [Chloroflexi bacterium]|nr:hypothetical protein [Chloroflexota bacterium]
MNWDQVLASEEAPTMLKPPRVSLRRGAWTCAGCFISIVLVAALLLCLIGFALSQLFKPASSAPRMERRALLLAATIPPSQKRAEPFGVFYQQTFTVEMDEGAAWLASSADGKGKLSTDDFAELHVTRPDGSTRTWSHDFRNTAHTEITSISAQDVSALFLPGRNQVTLTLRDLMPFTYWSQAYYLVFDAPAPTATATSTPKPTRLPTQTPTLNTAALSAATSVPTAQPTRLPTIEPTPLTNDIQPKDAEPKTSDSSLDALWLIGAGLGLAVVGVVFVMLVLKRKPPAPQSVLCGWLDVYDQATHDSLTALDLARYPTGAAFTLDPLRVSAWNGQTFVAAVQPSEHGAQIVFGKGQKAQRGDRRAIFEEALMLEDGAQFVIADRLRIEYRNPQLQWNADAYSRA